jgi:plasmid stabilization system protein ParE
MRAAAWYDREEAGLGDELLAKVGEAFTLLKEFPKAPPQIWDEYRRLLLRVFPYGFVYRIEVDEIIIVAIPHTKRRPGYWRRRLKTREGRG